MGKKRKKIRKESSKLLVKEEKPKNEPQTEENFDFGGLPERNLKKNLGCG